MAEVEGARRLENLPVTLFGSVMGIVGLAIAFLRFEHVMALRWGVGPWVLYLGSAWFLVLLSFYGAKIFVHPQAVREEFRHPIKVNFFPAVSISLLLLAIGYLELWPSLSRVLWAGGAVLHLAFTLKIVSNWLHKDYEIHVINPAWFIPVVGTMLVPIAGVSHADPEISWFFFSVGIVFWIVLFAITFYRVIFHVPIAQKLIPTLFILIAPPAVGFIAWVKLTGDFDAFARILFYFGLFTFLLLLVNADRFRRVPFFVSWWAYTFPLDAVTISLVLAYAKTGSPVLGYAAWVMLPLTSLLILYVAWRTFRAALRGQICVPE